MKRKLPAAAVALLLAVSAVVVGAAVFTGGPQSGEVTLVAPDGPAVTLEGSTTSNLTAPFPDNETVVWNTTAGNATFSSTSRTNVTVQTGELTGSWTNATGIDATAATLTINPEDKPPAEVGGDVTGLSYRGDIDLSDDSVAFVYSADGTGSVTVSGLAGSENWTAATTDGQLVDSGTTTASGEATITVDAATGAAVVLFQNDAPTVDNLEADPRDGETESTRDVTLSIPVNDSTFATSVGDELQVSFYQDGSQVDQQTITSNATVSTTVSLTDGGEHNWSVTVTDKYGGTVESDAIASTSQSEPFVFQTPSDLLIYNESQPSELVDNSTVTIQFYFDNEEDLVVSRNASDGKVNLTGLPVNQPFTVTADAEGFRSRRVYIESLTEQQKIYLLPDSVQFVETEFVLEDYTGRYPKEDSVLIVQRALNDEWQNVESDFFGATGTFPSQLAYDTRHRLILVNTETGDRKMLGTYTPLNSGEAVVEVVGENAINVRRAAPDVSVGPGTRSLAATDSQTVTVEVVERTAGVESWTAEVVYTAPDGTRTVLDSTSRSSPGTYEPSVNLSGRAGGNVTVVVDWTTDDGQSGSESEVYRVRQAYQNQNALLSVIGGVNSLLPGQNVSPFKTMVSVVLTVLFTGSVGQKLRLSTEQAGIVSLLSLTGFGVIGWVGYSLVFVSGVAFVSALAVRRGL